MSRVVKNNRGFLQLLADCPAYQRQFLTRFVPHAITRFPRGEITSLPTTTFLLVYFHHTTFLLFSLHHHHHHHHHRHHISIVFPPHHNHLISIVFPPQDSIRDYQLPFLIHFVAMSRVVNNNRGFLQLLAGFPVYQHQFLTRFVLYAMKEGFRRCH